MRKAKTRFYVAVVAQNLTDVPLMLSQRASGDFKSFVGTDKRKVVAKALKQAAIWGESSYHVYVGELMEHAEAKAEFTLERLGVR